MLEVDPGCGGAEGGSTEGGGGGRGALVCCWLLLVQVGLPSCPWGREHWFATCCLSCLYTPHACCVYPVATPIYHQPQVFKLQWGYLRLSANATTLAVEAVSNADGSLMDAFTLAKPPGWGQDWMEHQYPHAEAVAEQWYRHKRGHSYEGARRQQQVALQVERRGLQRPSGWRAAGSGWAAGDEGRVAASK